MEKQHDSEYSPHRTVGIGKLNIRSPLSFESIVIWHSEMMGFGVT
jgi:hypothetical protein